MKRRDQSIGRQTEGVADETNVIVDQGLRQRSLVGVPLEAGGQRLTKTDRKTDWISCCAMPRTRADLPLKGSQDPINRVVPMN